jgi:hypothetical protein
VREHVQDEDSHYLQILEQSKTPEQVAEILQILYAQETYTVGEMAHFVADPSANPYRSQISPTSSGYKRISCGHHPWLEARLVKDLSVESSDDDLKETVTWKEQTASGEWIQKQYTIPKS